MKMKSLIQAGVEFKPNTEGAFGLLPDATYRKSPGVSQSMLKPLAISPAHFAEAIKNPVESTAALAFGRIGHHKLFTPSATPFWAVRPDGLALRSPEGKRWQKKHYGKTWVDFDTATDINNAVFALKKNTEFKKAFNTMICELSCFKFYKHGKRKVLRKGRIDLVPPGKSLCDVKFVYDAREHAFVNLGFDLKWYMQAAYYLDLYNEIFPDDFREHFVFFAVEKTAPYPVQVYPLDQLAITTGRTLYKRLLNLYMECKATNKWPVWAEGSPYSKGPKTVGLPKWANKGQATKGDFIFA